MHLTVKSNVVAINEPEVAKVQMYAVYFGLSEYPHFSDYQNQCGVFLGFFNQLLTKLIRLCYFVARKPVNHFGISSPLISKSSPQDLSVFTSRL